MKSARLTPLTLLCVGLLAGLAACAPADPTRLVLMTHDSFAVSEDLLEAFEDRHGVMLDVLRAGDAGAMVNQAILTRDAPLADVLFGVDNTFLSRALEADIFVPYPAAAGENISAELRLGGELATPIDYGDVCVNYDREFFEASAPAPRSIEELAEAAQRSRLVVENPATSSPGLAFLLATIVRFGEQGEYTWRDYWADLVANDVLVVAGWEEAYYGSFSGGAGAGDRPLVVSYATSPVAEVFLADPQPEQAPTGVINDGCFRQVEFAAVLRGTRQPQLAGRLIEYLLSAEVQADIPLDMFVFPAVSGIEPPPLFVQHAVAVREPLTMDPATIAANRERWIEEWTDVVLR